MAGCSQSQLTVSMSGLKTYVVNISDWTNGKASHQNASSSQVIGNNFSDPESDHQKRSDIVHAIIHNHSLDHLRGILVSGWDVNEILRIPGHIKNDWGPSGSLIDSYRQRTALGVAARQGWTEGVKMLLEAGAKCMISDKLENPITLALHNHDCPPGLIELLLQHGADPNYHDGEYEAIPLLKAIRNHRLNELHRGLQLKLESRYCRYNQNPRIVQLLLEHGADPNVISESPVKEHPLYAALRASTTIFSMLIKSGADVTFCEPGMFPLPHRMVSCINRSCIFLQKELDLFFLHGGNINIECGEHGTPLEYALRVYSRDNTTRWLIRHGADTSPMKVTLLKPHFIPTHHIHFPRTLVILLQAGMKVSHGAVIQLSNMEKAISAWLQENRTGCEDLVKVTESMWAQLEEAEEGELQRMQYNLRKCNFPEYWTQQMVDLQEFSDDNLNVYPDWFSSTRISEMRQKWQNSFDQIHAMLEFLSQTQSLQWYCRRCVQENLVSLQPSVVKTLPIPAILKRYILCHEI